jgi:hypothetical protein
MLINLLRTTPVAVIVMNAMAATKGVDPDDFLKTFNIEVPTNPTDDYPVVEMEVRINGVLVPFLQEVEIGLNKIVDDHERDVKKAALEMLKASRLSSLLSALDNAEWRIEDEIQRLAVSGDAIPNQFKENDNE